MINKFLTKRKKKEEKKKRKRKNPVWDPILYVTSTLRVMSGR